MANFDYIDRKNTDSVKWSVKGMKTMASYADEDSLPMWVADMDFKTLPLAISNMKKRIEHGVFGYTIASKSYYDAVKWWYKKRYEFELKKEWIVTTPGIVPALTYIINTFTKKGENVIIQEPVYYPFRNSIELNERVVINNLLVEKDGYYYIDFEDLENKAKDSKTTLLIISSPHNPVGRVWTKEEINKIAQICFDNNVLLCADEIHSDLMISDKKFQSTCHLEEHLLENTIICTAPSKTFNLASISVSNLIIKDKTKKEKLLNFMNKICLNGSPNMLGAIAVQSVYTKEGEEWLEELLVILRENYKYILEFLALNLPNIKAVKLEGTYLLWLDFRGTGLTNEEIEYKMEKEAKIVTDMGRKFGESAKGFMRFNIACPQKTIEDAMKRLKKAFG